MMVRLTAILAAAALLSGCQTLVPIRPDAFDNGQRAAILLLHAPPKIRKAMTARSSGPVFDTAPILAEVRPVVIEAMARNPHFRLVPEAKVLAAPSYVAHGTGAGFWGYVSPPGYKSISSETLYPVIAREVGADMAMGLMLSLAYTAGEGAALVVVSIGVIGADGKRLWKGGGVATSELPIDVTNATAQARVDAFKDATRAAMANMQQDMTAELAIARAKPSPAR
jgi:hypothetical protein